VAEFVSDVATDLPKFGLDQPPLRLTLSSFASENTSETSAGDKPIVSILFGTSTDNQVFAKLDDEPFIVSLPDSILTDIFSEAHQWQPLLLFNLPPADLQSLEIAIPGRPTASIVRTQNRWDFAKGDGSVHQSNAEKLVQTVARLRAVRYLPPSETPLTPGNPAIIKIQFRSKSGSEFHLEALSSDPQELGIASSSTRSGTFHISPADFANLLLPLDQKNPLQPPPPAPSEPSQ
jgi:hypothetical protein